jgi:phosphohistidine phosphatase
MIWAYLVQHGDALPKEKDPERHLSEVGIRETRKIGEFLSKKGIKIDKIFHSNKRRAIMTAHILSKALDVDDVNEAGGLAPLDDPSSWVKTLMETDKNVMIVGHLPHLSKLLSMLLKVDTEVVKFRYSSVLCLERGDDYKWRIAWYIKPDII